VGIVHRDGLRGGGLRLLVPVLAVDHRRESVLRIALDVLPDVQHRAAGGVDQRAAGAVEPLQFLDRHPERRQDHHIIGAERDAVLFGIAEEANALAAQLVVDVRVVDDLAGQEYVLIGEPLAGLIGVVDGAIDAVAEAELPGQMDGEASRLVAIVLFLDLVDERAVIALGEHAGDLVFQVEAFPENQRGH
jgi:hypothetical protein